jgi:hypothetical protein
MACAISIVGWLSGTADNLVLLTVGESMLEEDDFAAGFWPTVRLDVDFDSRSFSPISLPTLFHSWDGFRCVSGKAPLKCCRRTSLLLGLLKSSRDALRIGSTALLDFCFDSLGGFMTIAILPLESAINL